MSCGPQMEAIILPRLTTCRYTGEKRVSPLQPTPCFSPVSSRDAGCGGWSCMKSEKWKFSHSVMSDSLQPHGLWPTKLLHPRDFLGKSTGAGCHFLLQRIFQTQGSNPDLPHRRQTLYCLSHQGSPMIMHGKGRSHSSLPSLSDSADRRRSQLGQGRKTGSMLFLKGALD